MALDDDGGAPERADVALRAGMNPFLRPVAAPWTTPRDETNLNAAASGRIERLVDLASVRPLRPAQLAVLLGAPGRGKTHLFTRLRRSRPDDVALYVGAPRTPDNLYVHVLGEVVTSLMRTGRLHELARWGALLALGVLANDEPRWKRIDPRGAAAPLRAALLSGVLDHSIADLIAGLDARAFFDEASRIFAEKRPEVRERPLRVILGLLFPDTETAARRTLFFDDPSDEDLERLGLRAPLDGDDDAADTLVAISRAVPRAAILFLDELETLFHRFGEAGTRAFFDVVRRLFEELRGVVLVIACHVHVWDAIGPHLDPAVARRIDQGHPVVLDQLTPERARTLVATILAGGVYGPAGVTPPSPTYPFAAADLERWTAEAAGNPGQLFLTLGRRLEELYHGRAAATPEPAGKGAAGAEAARDAVRREVGAEVAGRGATAAGQAAAGALATLLRYAAKGGRLPRYSDVKTAATLPGGGPVADVLLLGPDGKPSRAIVVHFVRADQYRFCDALHRAVAGAAVASALLVRSAAIDTTPRYGEHLTTLTAHAGSGELALTHEEAADLEAAQLFIERCAQGAVAGCDEAAAVAAVLGDARVLALLRRAAPG